MANSKKGGGNNRSHKPTGPQHYAPAIEGVIRSRATVALMKASGVNVDLARNIIRTSISQDVK